MGTSKPLTICVHPIFQGEPWLAVLMDKGHKVYIMGAEGATIEYAGVDLILGPNCARFVPGMERFLDLFLKGARVNKYGKVKV